MQVIKRNGQTVEFELNKIVNAINKVFIEVKGRKDIPKAQKIAGAVRDELELRNVDHHVEDIQDLVERELMAHGEYKCAKAYILYRKKRNERRKKIKEVYYQSEFLPKEFLEQYPDYPEHMLDISKFTYVRTYSRYIDELQRLETWKETCIRSIHDNISKDPRPRTKEVLEKLTEEAKTLFDAQFNLRSFLAGRALFVGGTKASQKFRLSYFNCSAVEPNKLETFKETMYLLSVGAGVGYRNTYDVVEQLPTFHQDKDLVLIRPKFLVPANLRQEDTTIEERDDEIVMTIGDSKEAWSNSIYYYLQFMTGEIYPNKKRMKILFNHIRPAGSILKTFGGFASGHEPLLRAFEKIHEVITNDYKDSEGNVVTKKPMKGRLRPIHVMHIMNSIAEAIVVGGTRRSAMIALFSPEDEEMMSAKANFTIEQYQDPKMSHYFLSNNTAIFKEKPSKETIEMFLKKIQFYGEPGFANEQQMLKRHPRGRVSNPCFEIILPDRGVCNLVTINLTGYIKEGKLDEDKLAKELAVLTRSAYRVTIPELELPEWDEVQKNDRLLGVSPTSWMDMVEKLGLTMEEESKIATFMRDIVRNSADEYADLLGLNRSLNVTAVKPSGTIGLVANAGSPGVHVQHSPYHIRRIRISKNNPLYKVISKLNWHIEDDLQQPDTTAVISFPIKTSAKRTKFDVSAIEQLERYKMFQKTFTDQNTSITVHVQNHEWDDVANWLYDNWDDFTGVTFLSLSDHKFLQAPYETIDEETYNEMAEGLDVLTQDIIDKYYEQNDDYNSADDEENCDTGACAPDRLF